MAIPVLADGVADLILMIARVVQVETLLLMIKGVMIYR